MQDLFDRFGRAVSRVMGSAYAFVTALLIVCLWAVTGPLFGFSNGWQLVINTGTTIITFLMVFLLQSSQNRDTTAIHQKLDELIEATTAAHDDLVGLEQAPKEVVDRIKREHDERRRQAQRRQRKRRGSQQPR